ncbi:MAG: GYF domain-containing protein [Nannocystaceae bacterium]|nr:zinc-ribbon domain-containing protein [bacterium]
MKIECDKCAAKYSIADEKVRGKTFKIRCKKCSNVIIVRDKGAAADAGADDAGADQGDPGWHLAINGETVGPLAEDDVRARYSAGEIDKDTAVWQEGFEDWIPLGDVPVFADLPDAPAADGLGGGYDDGYGQQDEDDPFANANQEDYAAGAAAAATAAVAAAAPSQPAASSPRVSSLTGQRNENSVLFSLDSLQALATNNNAGASPKPAAGSNEQVGTKGLATAAPGSEGSGLIDIRALGSMVGNDQPVAAAAAAPAADDAALPSFGGSGLGGLAAAPLVASPAPEPAAAAAAAAPPPPQRSNAPIYILMVLLILGLGGLAAYILLKPEQQPQVIVKEVPGAAPSVADKDDKEEDEDKDDEDEDKDKDDEDEKDGEDSPEGEEAAADADAGVAGSSKSGGKKSGGKRSGGKKSGTKKSGTNDDPLAGFGDPPNSGKSTSTSKKPAGKKKEDVSVDCILDPSKCSKGGSKKSSSSSSKKPADPNLPATLTSSDIRAGVAPYKGAAKACGSKHGAAKGTKVKVKLSISGASGTVSSASAQAPHQGTPLGNCVAAAVKKAKFKKFQKSTLGAVYPFTM